jgi:hypothetical protein
MTLDEDLMEELEQEFYARRVGERRRRTDEADGYFATGEDDDMADLKDAPAVKIEINCICGRPLEAATYIQDGLIKLVISPCLCAERRPG